MAYNMGMKLVQYLNKYFPNGAVGTFENETVEIVPHFLEKFGVNVKIEDNLYLFKYGMLEAKWSRDITHECRGTILRNRDGRWHVACLAFLKFFNQHEGHCPVWTEQEFNAACSDYRFMQKADGTCITIWWDDEKEEWRASTLGTITPQQCGESPWTFDVLFWNTLDKMYPAVREQIEKLDHRYTIITELCTVENLILTRYPEDRIYGLALRDKITGAVMPVSAMGIDLTEPSCEWFKDIGITNLAEAKAYVEAESKTDKYGQYPEGFVLYDRSGPVCKMKNEKYIQLHHACGAGDTKCTRNKTIEAFFAGNMDDLYPVLIPSMQEFADKLKDWWTHEHLKLLKAAESFKGKTFDSAKDYALAVKASVTGAYAALFFQNKEEKVGAVTAEGVKNTYSLREIDSEVFSEWMKNNYKKFEKELKALSGI